MRDLSEYKLIGCYLVKFYEQTGIDYIRYENIKHLTNNVMAKINRNLLSYKLLPIPDKNDILKNMISGGVFKTCVNGRSKFFVQTKPFEVSKGIQTYLNANGVLVFKLPKEVRTQDSVTCKNIKAMYLDDLTIELRDCVYSEVSQFSAKMSTKSRGR